MAAKHQKPSKPILIPASAPKQLQPELTGIHLRLADIAAALILDGWSADLEGFVRILLHHEYLWYRHGSHEEEGAARWIENRFGDAMKELEAARRVRRELPEPLQITRKTFVDQIRAKERNELIRLLGDFVQDADPEEISLLKRVMMFTDSRRGYTTDAGESNLAKLFMEELERDARYVKVPSRIVGLVETLADALAKHHPPVIPQDEPEAELAESA